MFSSTFNVLEMNRPWPLSSPKGTKGYKYTQWLKSLPVYPSSEKIVCGLETHSLAVVFKMLVSETSPIIREAINSKSRTFSKKLLIKQQ